MYCQKLIFLFIAITKKNRYNDNLIHITFQLFWAKRKRGVCVFCRWNFGRGFIERIRAFGCGIEGTEEAVLTFVLHGGFTDALFRKWLAICRARGSNLDSALCHITPGFVYPTRVFSLFPSHSASVVCLACAFIAHNRDFDERAVRRKLILQPLVGRLLIIHFVPFIVTATLRNIEIFCQWN